jgi:hypothetical protein
MQWTEGQEQIWTVLKSTVGHFAGEVIRSSVYHFAMNETEWPTVQKLSAILWTAVRRVEVCQVLGLGVLKKVGIEWNRTADSRMVLNERQDSSLLREICFRWHSIVWHQHCTVVLAQQTIAPTLHLVLTQQVMAPTRHYTGGTTVYGTNSAQCYGVTIRTPVLSCL